MIWRTRVGRSKDEMSASYDTKKMFFRNEEKSLKLNTRVSKLPRS